MKNYNLLSIILLSAAIIGCNGSKKTTEKFFSFDNSNFKAQYYNNDVLSLSLLNANNKKIDSIIYYVNDIKIAKNVGQEKINFDLKDQKLGYQNLKAMVYFDGDTAPQEITSRVELVSNIQPKLLKYTIVNTYPHDLKAYTQGLEFYRDTLYESTGNGAGNGTGIRGISSLRKTDYKTGKVYKSITLENSIFGEGITVLKNKVYQLTYTEMTAFVYNADNFKREKTFKYFRQMEGWGLTNDGANLHVSDGSEKIWVVNPEDFKEKSYINVYSGKTKIKNVNELEWINGKIYGNIYQKDAIAVINPANGAVEAVIDLKALKAKTKQHADIDVLNGIAYNPKTKTLFVTGKNWDKMFEIKIIE